MIADLNRKAIFPHVVADLCDLCSSADEETECDPSAPNFPWRALECAYRDVLEQALNLKALLMMEKEVMPVAGFDSVPTKAEATPVVNPSAAGESRMTCAEWLALANAALPKATIGTGYEVEAKYVPQTGEPDWQEAPDWAQWWAVDMIGRAYWYRDKPIADDPVWVPSGGIEKDRLKTAKAYGFSGNWDESLRERPKTV